VHLSNAFGTEPLHFTSVHIARPLSPASAAIDPASDKPLTFAGSADVIIPLAPSSSPTPSTIPSRRFRTWPSLSTSTRRPRPRNRPSRLPRHFVLSSMATLSPLPTFPDAKHVDHWYQLSGIDVLAPAGRLHRCARRLHHRRPRRHHQRQRPLDRRPRRKRLQASPATRNIGVSNQGIGGNHLLTDGLGPNVLARFDRDVLAQSGVRWVIVFEGVNDLGGLAFAPGGSLSR
jgi:hypothetical protein